jgi:citrate lyase subunit beta/citryl-CoA lyase
MALVLGHVEKLVARSREFNADVVVLDLEDTVPMADAIKATARSNMATALRGESFRALERSVRVNGPRTQWFVDDIEAVMDAGADSIVLPHTYGAADVLFAEQTIKSKPRQRPIEILLSVETPATLLELEQIAREATLVTALLVAPNDYALETGSSRLQSALMRRQMAVTSDEQIGWLRQKVVAVARYKGWNAIDAALAPDPRDSQGLRAAMLNSRELGFDGCTVLYPTHIDLANESFTPSAEEIAWAEETISRYQAEAPDHTIGADGARAVIHQHYEVARRVSEFAKRISTEKASRP